MTLWFSGTFLRSSFCCTHHILLTPSVSKGLCLCPCVSLMGGWWIDFQTKSICSITLRSCATIFRDFWGWRKVWVSETLTPNQRKYFLLSRTILNFLFTFTGLKPCGPSFVNLAGHLVGPWSLNSGLDIHLHFTLILSTSGRLMKQIFYLLSFPFSDFLAASVCYKLSEISLAHLLGQESAKSNLRGKFGPLLISAWLWAKNGFYIFKW